MASSTDRLPQTETSVNPPSLQDKEMWNRIIELEPVINSAARRMAAVYDDDAGELSDRMRMALIEKARQVPRILSQGNGYIFRTLTNEIHSYYRKLFGSKLQYHISSLDDLDEMIPGDDDSDSLDRSERSEAVRQSIEMMDDECQALVEAILKSGDELTRYAHGGVNVNALARKVGRPKSSVYGDMARLRVQLAVAIA
jgi:DNA-directed RNA polymerase specialized sigma24 family protein